MEKFRNITILLIEDNPADARLTKEYLKMGNLFNHELIWEENLESGINTMKTHKNIDIILCDISLPDSKDQNTTINRILNKIKKVPIVFLTGLNDSSLALEAIEQGAQDFISKSNISYTNLSMEIINSLNQFKKREHLEIQVGDRTRDLQKIVNKLQEEVEERKKVEKELKKANIIAKEANKTKTDFLARLSHELRTPLNAIIGFSQLLGDEVIGKMSEEQKKISNDIEFAGMYLLNLVNNILDISKIESNKVELHLERVNVKDLLNDILVLYKNVINKKNINLTIQFPYDNNESLIMDKTKIKEVLINLISNSIKAVSNKGKISVYYNVKPIENEFIVKDNGIGMKEEDFSKLFQPFSQIEGNRKEDWEGTGLGLYHSKLLVELHKGRIWFESTYNKGTQFHFTLPKLEYN